MTITLFALLSIVSIVHASTADSSLFPTSIPYPDDQNIANLKPYSQSYYVTNFVLDNSYSDLCKMNTSFFGQIGNSSSFNNSTTGNPCVDYFCECSIDPRVCFNLTHSLIFNANQTFRSDYFIMMNYCLSCNSEDAHAFRKYMSGGEFTSSQINQHSKCSQRFPSLERIQRSMLKHCNHGLLDDTILNSILFASLSAYANNNKTNNTSNNSNINNNQTLIPIDPSNDKVNIGIVDWRFFQPDLYHSNKYLKNYSSNIEDNTLHLFESLFLSETVNPLMCWCRNQNGPKFAFQCGDAYQLFFIPFKYFGTPFIIIVLMLSALIISVFYNTIPFVVTKRRKISHQWKQEIALRASSKWYLIILGKIMFHQLFLTDLRSAILFFQTCTGVFMIVENIIGFVWNFKFWNSQFENNELYGCFRALSIFSMSLTFTTVLVHWSHVVDLISSTSHMSNPKRHLSRKNILLLVSIYLFNIMVILIGSVVSGVLKRSTPLFACAAASMILLPSALIVAFTIYSFRIYFRLKRTQTNFVELRFTRFIIILNIGLATAFVLACVFIPTFIARWDILFMALITYALCHEEEFKQCYGVSMTRIFLCVHDYSNDHSDHSVKIEQRFTSPRKQVLHDPTVTTTMTSHPHSAISGEVREENAARDSLRSCTADLVTPVKSIAISENLDSSQRSEKVQGSSI
nr:unnamed protein product [Naegleria fowleri]